MDSGLNERATPAQLIDQALSLLRRASAEQWLRGLCASLPLAAAVLSLYALEYVVGARPPLQLFAVLCALAYWARFRVLSGLAREHLAVLAPRVPLGARSSQLVQFKTAMVAGIGSWFWVLCLWFAAQRSFVWLLVCLPMLCVRGALAPSLLARAACAPDAGLTALARASSDTRGARQLFAGVELLALTGLLLLFGNLYALAALVLLVASSVLGLDVGFVSALIAPSNELVPLLLLGAAALALEPLRAAISALAYQRARERWQGADLYAAIDELASPRRRSVARPPSAAGLALLLFGVSLVAAPGHAQPGVEVGASDTAARQKAREILTRAEFQPSETDSGEGTLAHWLDRRLRARELSDRDASAPPRFELRLPPLALTLVSAALMLAVLVWLARSMQRAKRGAAVSGAPAEPTSAERVAEAARLAERAQYAASLRSLYLACLQALGGFDSAHTNGQLLQRLTPGPTRTALEHLTLSVERCSYGQQPATCTDYEAARATAEGILNAVGREVQP